MLIQKFVNPLFVVFVRASGQVFTNYKKKIINIMSKNQKVL